MISPQVVKVFPEIKTMKSSHVLTASPSEKEIQPVSDFEILGSVWASRFPIFQVRIKGFDRPVVAKLFPEPEKDVRVNFAFQNETRFAGLQHPHIVNILASHENRVIPEYDNHKKVSLILMEYAPHGDLFDLVKKKGDNLDEKLIRTMFHQVLHGISFLHAHKYGHLDIKLENILIAEDMLLKITDFDLTQPSNGSQLITQGSKFYRAPEIIQGECRDVFAADIYSLGILMFVLKTKGLMPHSEDQLYHGINLMHLMINDLPRFWETHTKISGDIFDKDFRNLFEGMVKFRPSQRLNMKKIKESNWFNGVVYNQEEFAKILGKIL